MKSARIFAPALILNGSNLSSWMEEIRKQISVVYPSIADLIMNGEAENPKLNGFYSILRKVKAISEIIYRFQV